jgi:lysozyme family protein
MMDFDTAFTKLIDQRREGTSLSLDPTDRGNWTSGQIGLGQLKGSKFGISAAAHPTEDIANLTLERAAVIYQRDYWGPAGCDAVPPRVKFDLFDMAVNSGVRNAVKTLQKAAGLPPAEQDGRVPELLLLCRFNGTRLLFLADASGWPTQGRGWTRRVATNMLEA